VALLTCPFCRGSHPAETARCPVTGALLPRRKAPPSPDTTEGPEDEPDAAVPDPHAEFLAEGDARATGVTDLALRLPTGEVVRVAPGTSVRLGREASPIADVCPDNVSRHHADVRADSTRVVVIDAGSVNGTFLNDQRLPPGEPRPVLPGDTIRLAADPPFLLHVTPSSEEGRRTL
jgi:hypothetical protein